MPITIGDALLKIGVDTKDFDREVQGLKNKLVQHSRAIGAAMTGIGAAGLAIVESTRKMNAQLGVTALNLGVSQKEMRNLALESTNVTFPLKEVTATFDLLARAGVKDTEVLKSTSEAFDMLGDAVGSSASEVTARMIPAMKTYNLSAEEMAGKIDAVTYLARNSTVSLDNFGSIIGYITPELVEMGLTLDDTIALMAIMESRGMSGEVATRAFRRAITEATNSQIPLNVALGITSEEVEAYKGKLEGATGLTSTYAEAANKQYGIMDNLKQAWSELTLRLSGFLEPLEPILAGMTALGPLIMALSTSIGQATVKWIAHTAALVANKVALLASAVAIKAVTAAQWLWNAAMTANPIGLLIAAIGGLVAAGIALWRNWDKVVDFFKIAWINIKIFFLTGVEKILEALAKFTGWIPGLGKKIQEAHDKISGMIDAEKVKKDSLEAEQALKKVTEATEETTTATEEATDANKEYSTSVEEATEADREHADVLADKADKIDEITRAVDEQVEALKSIDRKVKDAIDNWEYENSVAGKLRITFDNVITALHLMGKTNDEITLTLANLGDEQNNVLRILEAFGITAVQVADALGIEEEAVLNLQTSYEDLGDTAISTSARVAQSAAEMKAALQETIAAGGYGSGREGDRARSEAILAYQRQRIAEYREAHGRVIRHPGANYAKGGIIPEPTLLCGLKSMRPYAVAGEKGSEWVGPRFPSVTITGNNFYVREEADINKIGERLVQMIRLRQGFRGI